MAALVSYGSSDEEDNLQEEVSKINVEKRSSSQTTSTNGVKSGIHHNGNAGPGLTARNDAPLVGPSLGPTDIPTELLLPEDDEVMAPQSPYSANRALLRDLTLPIIPNYEIPPSPPGSPVEGTNSKFKHFLELKKQGVHFNERLAKSSALKNPSLMQKLMDFADIDEAGQYATTLSKDFWNPNGFPEYAYKEELAHSQQKIRKKKEDEKTRGQRESVEFVPAAGSGESLSRSGTPGASGRSGQKSAAERIMAGLDRGRSSSPQVQGTKRKTRFDS
ncbi:HCNGP-domain-containing protein [Stipitochalara longipes BDJ]|nr:HCNGP-domain-containing protein [Stipitochalara longipes BDJ]